MSHKDRPLSLVFFLIPIILVFGSRRLIGHAFTGWDTHDLGFVNFVYFRDCLASGTLPFWNPFIQSGTFFPSLFQIGHFSLFQFPFALLALLIPPMLAYEWLIQFVVLTGGIGAYFYFRSVEVDQELACLGASIYTLTTMVINVGQIWFIFSFAALPWLLAAARSIVEGKRELTDWPLFGIILGFAYASGYQWMNLVNTGIFTCYTIYIYLFSANRARIKEAGLRFALFLLPLLAVHLVMIYPGLANLRFNYSHFAGDYVNPEPRLRALGGGGWAYTHLSLGLAVMGLISWASFPTGSAAGWTLGVGWATCVLLLGAICRKPKLRSEYFFWIAIVVVGLLYASAGERLSPLIRRLPFFSSNRWWVLGVDYSVIALVILAITWLGDAFGTASLKATGRGKLFFRLSLGILALFLLYQHVPWYEITIFLGLFIVLGVDGVLRSRRSQIVSILTLAILDCLLLVYKLCPGGPGRGIPMDNAHEYSRVLANRKTSPVVQDRNERRLGNQKEYAYTDVKWYVDKSPYSHGYDPLGNPVYWYIKDTPIVAYLFSVTTHMREEAKILRSDHKSDNSYVTAIVADILSQPEIPTVNIPVPGWANIHAKAQDKILQTELRPNEGIAQIQTSGPALVTFNNNYVPGWHVFINEKKAPLISVNHLFMGVELPSAGIYTVQFKFKPIAAIVMILASYAALIVFVSLWFARKVSP